MLLEGEEVELFIANEFSDLQLARWKCLDIQMRSLIRGDEDEDASGL